MQRGGPPPSPMGAGCHPRVLRSPKAPFSCQRHKNPTQAGLLSHPSGCSTLEDLPWLQPQRTVPYPVPAPSSQHPASILGYSGWKTRHFPIRNAVPRYGGTRWPFVPSPCPAWSHPLPCIALSHHVSTQRRPPPLPPPKKTKQPTQQISGGFQGI